MLLASQPKAAAQSTSRKTRPAGAQTAACASPRRRVASPDSARANGASASKRPSSLVRVPATTSPVARSASTAASISATSTPEQFGRLECQLGLREQGVAFIGGRAEGVQHAGLQPLGRIGGDAHGRAILSAVLKPMPHTSRARRYGSWLTIRPLSSPNRL